MNRIGPKVQEIRMSQGLIQEQLAAKCNVLGWDLSRSSEAKIEVKLRRISDIEVALLAEALEVDVNSLYEELKEVLTP